MSLPRRTLTESIRIDGVGLFTGSPASVTIEPKADGGIAFARGPAEAVPATIDRLHAEPVHPAFASMPARHTSVAGPGGPVHTVEHILSALAGLGVTDAVIRPEGPEIPIADGSAAPFAEPIRRAGLRDLPGEIRPIQPREPIEIADGPASIRIEPADTPAYRYELDYGPDAPIPPQAAEWTGSPDEYAEGIAPARTFCLREEAEAMQKLGLFAHLTPRDMLVFGPEGPIENELRWPDEPARHKLLDLIGDLALAGRPIRARITARRSGHALNHDAARRLAALA